MFKTNMKKISLLVLCIISNTMMQADAFDITTHTVMTVNAVQQSNLALSPSTSNLIKSLGLRDDETAMGQNYLHMGSPITIRNLIVGAEARAIEDVKQASTIPASNTISGWLMRGAIREDDNSVETADSDEPGGVFNRVFGHFYDPVNVRGLTVAGITLGPIAPDWALAAGGNNTIGSRQNYFQIRHAREAMWRALTLKAYDPASQLIAQRRIHKLAYQRYSSAQTA